MTAYIHISLSPTHLIATTPHHGTCECGASLSRIARSIQHSLVLLHVQLLSSLRPFKIPVVSKITSKRKPDRTRHATERIAHEGIPRVSSRTQRPMYCSIILSTSEFQAALHEDQRTRRTNAVTPVATRSCLPPSSSFKLTRSLRLGVVTSFSGQSRPAENTPCPEQAAPEVAAAV